MEKFKKGDKVIILDNIIENLDKSAFYDSDDYKELAKSLIGKTCTIIVAVEDTAYAFINENQIVIPKASIMSVKEYRRRKLKEIFK